MSSMKFVLAGGLMTYGPDHLEIFRLAVQRVYKILQGVDPGELPVQQPTRLELAINAKTEGAQHAHSVQVNFDDGTRSSYGLMIGADGLLSKVRAPLFPERAKAEIALAARTFC